MFCLLCYIAGSSLVYATYLVAAAVLAIVLCLHISLVILRKFKQINQLLPLKSSENLWFFNDYKESLS